MLTDTSMQLEQAWRSAQLWREQALLQARDCVSAQRHLSRLRREAVVVPEDAIEQVLTALLGVRRGAWDLSIVGASPEWEAAERIVQQIRSWSYTGDCGEQCGEQHTYRPSCVQYIAPPADLAGLAAREAAAYPVRTGDAH